MVQPIIRSTYSGAGTFAIQSPLNEEPLNADTENFKPIDFLIGGYGTCMMGTMAKVAEQNGFIFSEARTEIGFEPLAGMSRIDTIDIKCFIKNGDYTAEQKQILEDAAKKLCPIGNSLLPDIKRSYEFLYGAE